MTKRLLIAEDNETNREMLSAFARALGYDVTAVNDGVDMLHLATEGTFDAIITDLMMAPLDGAAATEILKMLGDSTPVIALTALEPEELSLVEERFTKIFHKPCNFKELFEYVDHVTKTDK
jgi:CheY-like chemotaxis protein